MIPRSTSASRLIRKWFPAQAENDWYGESPKPVGFSGSTCQYDCPACTSQSTNLYASRPRSPMPCPPGKDVGWRRMPEDRGNAMPPSYQLSSQRVDIDLYTPEATSQP